MSRCPAWCVADHAGARESREHHGATQVVGVTLEGRGSGGPHEAELIVEVSRRHGEAAVWVYLGDGWTGFSLSLESATRLSAALAAAMATATTSPPPTGGR
jgi:hypothetical protein